MSLSSRGAELAAQFADPFQFSKLPGPAYDAATRRDGVIDLTYAENQLMIGEVAGRVAASAATATARGQAAAGLAHALSYPGASRTEPRFAAAAAAHLNRFAAPAEEVRPEHVFATSNATAALSMLGQALFDKGDVLLVARPAYGRLLHDFGGQAGVEVRLVDLMGVDPFSVEVIDRFYEAVRVVKNTERRRVRGVLITTPHNPLGQCYDKSTMLGFVKLCAHFNIHLISDEVYALSAFNVDESVTESPYVSALSLTSYGVLNKSSLHVVYGFSKDFAAGGLKLGCIISQNQGLRQALSVLGRFHSPSGPSLAIASSILEDQAFVSSFLETSRSRLRWNFQMTVNVFERAGIKYWRCRHSCFFIYANFLKFFGEQAAFDKVVQDRNIAEVVSKYGVFIQAGEEHAEEAGWFRIVYSLPVPVLREALFRLVTALYSHAGLTVPSELANLRNDPSY